MKALVGAFNQEKALVGAFSVIVQPVVEPMDRFTALDQAHTQSYCPLNKDGRKGRDRGASLVDLKKRKNAAGNFPTYKKLTAPLHSFMRQDDASAQSSSESSAPARKYPRTQDQGDQARSAKMPPSMTQLPVTEPLPRSMRPVTPPPVLPQQPPSAQLTMYRHYMYLQYYR